MNYKKRKPKEQRASCSLCKPQKAGWLPKEQRMRVSDQRRFEAAKAWGIGL